MRRPTADQDPPLARTANRILLGIVVAVCLTLFGLWRAENPRIERLRMHLLDSFTPAIEWVGAPIRFVSDMTRDYREFIDLYEQNRALRREIGHLRAWRETARRLEEENAQLRALNNVRLAEPTSFVTGEVIADSGGPFRESALVNVGRQDGVIDGSAVIDGDGLVGRVVGVGERAARVLLLTDFSSRVPVLVQPSGRHAILSGDGTIAPRIEFIDDAEKVRPGDQIATSGDGGVFPPDVPVGRLVEVSKDRWRAALRADYDRLDFVRIIRYLPNTQIDEPAHLIVPGRRSASRPGGDGDVLGE